MVYDLIIIGAGPAGLTASIYSSRYKINHLVIGEVPGGLVNEAHSIWNYPTEMDINGFDLMQKMKKNAEFLGAEIKSMDKVVEIKKEKDIFNITTESNTTYQSKTVLLTTGTKHRKLGVDREDDYVGKGLAYCATCDAMFYKDKVVGVVGSGDSAMTAALYLSKIATKVYLLVRGDHLKGEVAWIDQITADPKIELWINSSVKELKGVDKLEEVIISQEDKMIPLSLDGLFVEVGTDPDKVLPVQLNLETELDYVKVNQEQATNVEGVWAAGDLTTNSNYFRQITTAMGEGSVASYAIFSYLQRLRNK